MSRRVVGRDLVRTSTTRVDGPSCEQPDDVAVPVPPRDVDGRESSPGGIRRCSGSQQRRDGRRPPARRRHVERSSTILIHGLRAARIDPQQNLQYISVTESRRHGHGSSATGVRPSHVRTSSRQRPRRIGRIVMR